ncbi:MAG: YafY family protein [Ahrensia sp.]|nr:YafY family protein [Ahrensia sp.]
MRRADRLFQIVQHLRGGRLVTAAQLAEKLEVSERTIYRDIVDLQSNGVPIDGERGVGYIMRSGFDLPPLMFTRAEIVSLVAGARFIKAWGGLAMAQAAREALVKIEAVIPEGERDRINRVEIHAPNIQMNEASRALVDHMEAAIDQRRILDIDYRDAADARTSRAIRPLSLWYWGKVWTVLAWCEKRQDFRLFRIDRIQSFTDTGRTFAAEKGKTVQDFYALMEREGHPPAFLD